MFLTDQIVVPLKEAFFLFLLSAEILILVRVVIIYSFKNT